jgi:hypothetical protein
MAAYATPEPTERDVVFEPPRGRMPVSMPVSAVAAVELPWLPGGKPARVDGVEVTRRHHLLSWGDGRSAGRFQGLSLLHGAAEGQTPAGEPGLIEVTYQTNPGGPNESDGLPLRWDESAEIVRRMPTRTGSWLSAITPSGGIVQMSWDDGQLWLETPHPHEATSTGKHATVEEAVRMLRILAEEDRVAIAELPGAIARPW